jgi:hypothetical protein
MPSEETVNFTPVSYDIDKLPPEAPDGHWDFRIKAAKIRATKPEKGAYPMIELVVMLDTAHDAENKPFEGSELREWLVFFPEDHKAARQGKQKMQRWVDACRIEREVIPKAIRTPADLQPLVQALEDSTLEGWTVQRKDKQNGELRATMQLTEPTGLNLAGLPPVEAPSAIEEEIEEEEEEEEIEPPPPPVKKKSKK